MEKRKVPFPERILIKAIALDKDLKDGKLEPEVAADYAINGIKTAMGSMSCTYKFKDGVVLIEFVYKDFLLLGFYKGKETKTRNGLEFKGRFVKKAPSNIYRGELKLIRDSLKILGFNFKDIYEKKPSQLEIED